MCYHLWNCFFVFDAMHDVSHFNRSTYDFKSFVKFSSTDFYTYEVLISNMRCDYQILQTRAGKERLMQKFCT